jgi:hypothetical protein
MRNYPINFVVKHQTVSSVSRTARPEAVKKPVGQVLKTEPDLFPDRRHLIKWRRSGNSRMSFGGAERDRTVDPLLAKQVLSQLSYSPTGVSLLQRWWAWVDSNYRPHPYQGCALTN